jgi:hypothetical protein
MGADDTENYRTAFVVLKCTLRFAQFKPKKRAIA